MQGERRGVASTGAIRAAKSQQQGGTVPVIAVVPPEGLASEAEATACSRRLPASAGAQTERPRIQ